MDDKQKNNLKYKEEKDYQRILKDIFEWKYNSDDDEDYDPQNDVEDSEDSEGEDNEGEDNEGEDSEEDSDELVSDEESDNSEEENSDDEVINEKAKFNIVLNINGEDLIEEEREDSQCFCKKALTKFTVKEDGWWCNKCEEETTRPEVQYMPKGSIMWGCKKCDFDMCQKCYEEENVQEINMDDEKIVNTILDLSLIHI